MTQEPPAAPPLVDAAWLRENLGRGDVRVLDASWHLPAARRDGAAEFALGHIPGAAFFSIDGIADPGSPLPHMAPGAGAFGDAVGRLGIGNGDHVVAYAATGIGTAPRAWWMFRLFGHDRVSVLDGGLPAWTAAGGALEAGEASPEPRTFRARARPELVRDLESMRRNLGGAGEQVLDARSRGRFRGEEPEPRAGLRGGHIPGSRSLPYDSLLDSGAMRPPAELARLFREAGVEEGRPLALTCGSGVSACVLGLGLTLAGRDDWAVYDGSWTEWGGRDDVPVET